MMKYILVAIAAIVIFCGLLLALSFIGGIVAALTGLNLVIVGGITLVLSLAFTWFITDKMRN